ncbi:MAG TPA: hypothetical protein VHO03_04455 [Ignavibacteriales bacterium]|nr:hypothetical protein [Ignavibacteriales bacterium]
MIHYQILKDLWAILAVLTGVAVLFFTVLNYFDMWRPRMSEYKKVNEKGKWILFWRTVPWLLKLSYIVLFIWAIAYGLYLVYNPPNW